MNTGLAQTREQQATILRSLLTRIQQKDETAMAELYTMTQSELMAVARRMSGDFEKAQEVLQDVYTYVWLHSGRFSADRGSVLAWLYMLTRSRALDALRQSRRRGCEVPIPEKHMRLTMEERPSVCREIWRHGIIRRGVLELPLEQGRLVKLAFYEGYTHSEIAHTTGLPLGTVKARLRGALGRLRTSLAKKEARDTIPLSIAA